jgi:hypothetical protein
MGALLILDAIIETNSVSLAVAYFSSAARSAHVSEGKNLREDDCFMFLKAASMCIE